MRARGTLAEILWLAEKKDEACRVASEPASIHEAKGDVTGVGALRQGLARVGVNFV